MTSFVVHYQEIALKGKNRPWFLTRLIRNLRRAVSDLDVTAVKSVMGRIEVVLGPTADPAQVGERIRRTFGIANFSYAGRAPLDLDAITRAILDGLGDRPPSSFRVSARRACPRWCCNRWWKTPCATASSRPRRAGASGCRRRCDAAWR